MIAKAQARYLRISPFKMRLIINLVKGENAKKAMSILDLSSHKGAYYLKKLLKSAIANAKNKGYEDDKLFISKSVANPGPMLKRYRAASFGRATTIRKRTSHVLIELDSPEKMIENVKVK
jgi:large subunit ribosomal protein L22